MASAAAAREEGEREEAQREEELAAVGAVGAEVELCAVVDAGGAAGDGGRGGLRAADLAVRGGLGGGGVEDDLEAALHGGCAGEAAVAGDDGPAVGAGLVEELGGDGEVGGVAVALGEVGGC